MKRVDGQVPPMWAANLSKVRSRLTWPMLCQPKVDGIRCIATRSRAGVLLRSRNGEPIRMAHIADAMAPLMLEGEQWDGELHAPGEPFDVVARLVKNESPRVVFCAFDVLADAPYQERAAALDGLPLDGVVHRLPTVAVGSIAEAMFWHDYYVDAGHEGAMLRSLTAGYMAGQETAALVKVKVFEDHEYRATDYRIAPDGSVVFDCLTDDGKPFRARLHTVRKALVDVEAGALVKVKHFGYTINGIPRLPTALGVRPAFDATR